MCLNELAYGRRLRNDIQEFPDENYCLMFPLEGLYAIEAIGSRVEADLNSVTVINPTLPVTLEAAEDYRNLSARITRSAVDNALANRLGEKPDEPVVFSPHPQSAVETALPLRNLVLQLWRECQTQGTHNTVDIVGREIERLVATMLLTTIRHNYTERLEAGVQEAQPSASCRNAAEFIRSNAWSDITLEDVVRTSGLARTTLYSEFRQHFGMTPMEYLRRERLRMAHELLSSGREDLQSVARIAFDCGFSHLSRFANYYKRQYGELPSETLQKSKDNAH